MSHKNFIRKVLVLIGLFIQLTLVIAMAQETQLAKGDSKLIYKKGNTIFSTHELRFALKVPEGYRSSDILHYYPDYHGHPFEVSAISVFNDRSILMLHAERVSDQSGFLEYSYLEKDTLSGLEFYMQDRCFEVTEELLHRAVDLQFFSEAGYIYGPALYIRQYFITSDDGNAEVVLGYAENACDCDDTTINEPFKKFFIQRLREKVSIEDLN